MKTVIALFFASFVSLLSQATIPSYFPDRCISTHSSNSSLFSPKLSTTEPLEKEVMGWHPYWANATAHTTYDYTVLNHLSYFGYELEADGSLKKYASSISDSAVIAFAKEQGCKTSVTIICFNPTIFSNVLDDEDKYTLFLNDVVDLVSRLGVDEVIFDFEPLSSFSQELIRDFSLDVKFALFEVPSVELITVSIAMPAVDWNNSINLEHYSLDFDKLIVMAYDYYWKNSPIAGPVSPLMGENKNVQNTIATYLQSVPKEQLIIAYPWYGYDWPVTSSQRKASSIGGATAKTLSEMKSYTSQYTTIFDTTTKVPWMNYSDSQFQRQIWFEDSLSLSNKYYEINKNDLAGVGIWALSYANGVEYVWSEIRKQFERITTISIDANVQSIDFKGVQIRSTSSQSIKLINTGNSELLISSISVIGADSVAYTITEGKPTSTPISVAPNDSMSITIQFEPTEVKTYNNASIVVVSNASNNLTIPVTGEGVPLTSVQSGALVENIGLKLLGQNPITSEAAIEISLREGSANGKIEIVVIDATGANIHTFEAMNIGVGTTTLPFSVENFASGAYTIVVSFEGKTYTLPLRIVR